MKIWPLMLDYSHMFIFLKATKHAKTSIFEGFYVSKSFCKPKKVQKGAGQTKSSKSNTLLKGTTG